jgi:hypothetical protein
MKKDKPSLKTNRADIITSTAKGLAGACPLVGGLVAEAIDQLIPNQKLDRVVGFLKILDHDVSQIDSELSNLKNNLSIDTGLDLLEDGIVQASRAITEERRHRIANLLTTSFTQEKLKCNESKKLRGYPESSSWPDFRPK